MRLEQDENQSKSAALTPLSIDRCVILGGGISPAPIARKTGLAVFDLPITPERCLADLLQDRFLECFDLPHEERPLVLRSEGLPVTRRLPEYFELRTEREKFRGPAGAVRDVVGEGDPDSWILVMEGHRYYGESLRPMLAHATSDTDVVIGSNADRSPTGVYLLRRRVVEMAPSLGFLDLKEQLLKKCRDAGGRTVAGILPGSAVTTIRTTAEYLRAVDHAMSSASDEPGAMFARRIVTAQRWTNLIEPEAKVHPEAVLVESVVMEGAEVGPGAVVVRSLVCPGAVVQAGEELVDTVQTRAGRTLTNGATVPSPASGGLLPAVRRRGLGLVRRKTSPLSS